MKKGKDPLNGDLLSQEDLNEQIMKDTILNNKDLQELLGFNTKTSRASYSDVYVHVQDKISSTLVEHPIINAGEQELRMEARNSKTPVTTKVSVSLNPGVFQQNKNIFFQNPFHFTFFEKSILDAIYTLYLSGNTIITLRMIAKAMTGKSNQDYHPSANFIKDIEDSVTILANTRININLTEEVKAFHLKLDKNNPNSGQNTLVMNENLLNIRFYIGEVNGQKTKVIELLSKPILNTYAQMRKQVSYVPALLMDSPVNNTRQKTACQAYLLFRICNMYRANSLKRTILFDTLVNSVYPKESAENDTGTTFRSKKTRLKAIVKQILDYWVSIHFIDGYSFRNEKNTAEGYYRINIVPCQNGRALLNLINPQTLNEDNK